MRVRLSQKALKPYNYFIFWLHFQHFILEYTNENFWLSWWLDAGFSLSYRSFLHGPDTGANLDLTHRLDLVPFSQIRKVRFDSYLRVTWKYLIKFILILITSALYINCTTYKIVFNVPKHMFLFRFFKLFYILFIYIFYIAVENSH